MLKINESYRQLIPALTEEEFKQLEENCIKEGIRDAIITWNSYIVDGHNRYAIAEKHGLDYKLKEKSFKDENEVKEWMILNQFGRRNLSNYQRSLLALELEDVFREKAKENLRISGEKFGIGKGLVISPNPIEQVDTRKELAKVAKVSEDTIKKVKVIEQKAPEELKQKLRSGEATINQVYQDIRKEEKKELKQQKIEEYKKLSENFTEEDIKIINDDFRNIELQDNSIDLILTDPPYPEEYLTLWNDLFQLAEKKLKPGAFLVAYSGQMHLNKIFKYANNCGLSYYWMMNIEFTKKPLIQGRNVINEWKPILVFQKGFKKIENVFSDKISMTYTEREMHQLNWGQTVEPFEFLLERFSHEMDLVFEPFAGSGTTLIACKNKKRKCIASEIDSNYINLIKGRLYETELV